MTQTASTRRPGAIAFGLTGFAGYWESDCLSSGISFLALESFVYIAIQTIAKIVSTTGCAAMTPFNCHKPLRMITDGINNITFLIIVMSRDFIAMPNA